MTPEQIITALQDARLEWAMVCHCTCAECDRFYNRISAIEDALEPKPCWCDDHQGTHLRCPTHGSQSDGGTK